MRESTTTIIKSHISEMHDASSNDINLMKAYVSELAQGLATKIGSALGVPFDLNNIAQCQYFIDGENIGCLINPDPVSFAKANLRVPIGLFLVDKYNRLNAKSSNTGSIEELLAEVIILSIQAEEFFHNL